MNKADRLKKKLARMDFGPIGVAFGHRGEHAPTIVRLIPPSTVIVSIRVDGSQPEVQFKMQNPAGWCCQVDIARRFKDRVHLRLQWERIPCCGMEI